MHKNNSHPTWSRREFISAVTLAGVGAAVMMNPLAAWAIDETDPRVAAIVKATMGIDTHNHIDVPLATGEVPGPKIDLMGEMKRSGLSAICATFAVDYQQLNQPGVAYERFLNGLTAMDEQLKSNGMKRSFDLTDLQTAHKKRQPTVIQSVEGGHFLEGQLGRLQVAYDRGLRLLTLLHDSDASVPLGDVFTNPVRWDGLTSFGAEVIKECNRLGILVDLSHANVATVNAALKVARHPVLVSHTGLDTQLGKNERMAKMMMPRLISKEHAKSIADTGGVIGVWTHLADSALEYAENIRAMVAVVGIDHVCIGTDTKLTPAYSPGGGFGQRPADFEQKQGQALPKKENKDQGFRGTGSNQNWQDQKTGFYYAVVEGLLNVGFDENEIGKIGGGNFCRVFNEATEGKN
jgi:membrane dipeptidase